MRRLDTVEVKRNFFNILKQVPQGESFQVISRGKPIAIIARPPKYGKEAARKFLLERLHSQKPIGLRSWVRDELYDHDRHGNG